MAATEKELPATCAEASGRLCKGSWRSIGPANTGQAQESAKLVRVTPNAQDRASVERQATASRCTDPRVHDYA